MNYYLHLRHLKFLKRPAAYIGGLFRRLVLIVVAIIFLALLTNFMWGWKFWWEIGEQDTPAKRLVECLDSTLTKCAASDSCGDSVGTTVSFESQPPRLFMLAPVSDEPFQSVDTLFVAIADPSASELFVALADPSASDMRTISNFLNDINIILLIVTVIIVAFTLIATIAGVRFFRVYVELKQSVDKAEKGVLEAALTTMASVRMIAPTQIISSEYYSAISTITETVQEHMHVVEDDRRYTPLLVVEAMEYWQLGHFRRACSRLEKAERLGGDRENREIVAYHIARVQKQLAANIRQPAKRKFRDRLDKARDWAGEAGNDGKVIILSADYLEYVATDNGEQRTNLRQTLRETLVDCARPDIKIKLDAIDRDWSTIPLEDKVDDDEWLKEISPESAFSAMQTLIALTDYLHNNNGDDRLVTKEAAFKAAETALDMYKLIIPSESGANVKAAWYLTMARLAMVAAENNNNTEKYKNDAAKYLDLSRAFYEQARKLGTMYFFTAKMMAEVLASKFNEELKNEERKKEMEIINKS